MNKLQSELHRLYAPNPSSSHLVSPQGRVRAMVLELARPAEWSRISAVWHGVQTDLGLPAPAIAITGRDAFQLWFSLVQAVPVAQAGAFLAGLRSRYLNDVTDDRLGLLPRPDPFAPDHTQHAMRVPAEQPDNGHWSAFVAPDLAPVFAESPWLDIQPNPDGQAELLAPLDSIQTADFQAALQRLGMLAPPAVEPVHTAPTTPSSEPRPLSAPRDPRRFLLDVMNDPAQPMALRIEAAKALLPYSDMPDPAP